MLRIGALSQDLKDLALRWQKAVTRELRLEAPRRLESISEVVKRTTSKMQREVRITTERLG